MGRGGSGAYVNHTERKKCPSKSAKNKEAEILQGAKIQSWFRKESEPYIDGCVLWVKGAGAGASSKNVACVG